MIAFSQYARIKDNYCIGYFGPSEPLLLQLRDIRPFLEHSFPNIKIYIACRDQSAHVLKGCDRIIKMSDLKSKRDDFGQLSELAFDGKNHPITKLFKDMGIGPCPIPLPLPVIF